MNDELTLTNIVDGLHERGTFRPSRIGPIRTAIKQYADVGLRGSRKMSQ